MNVRRCAALGLVAILAGCASAPTRFHTLDPVAPSAAPAARAIAQPIRLDSVTVPPELDRPQIVRRAGPGRLDLADDDRWAGALDELARRALAVDLQQRLPAGATLRDDDPAAPSGLHRIDVVIERFEGTVGGPVALDARWTLLADNPDRALVRREEHIEVPASNDIDGTVTAMSAALGQLADRIVAEIR
jgi:uncharacterized lipoprotein YmbA